MDKRSVRSNHFSTYENRYSDSVSAHCNQSIAAEHSFLQRHARRSMDAVSRKLTLATLVDPRESGVGSYGGHIAREVGAPGPLNNPYVPNIGKGFTADPKYRILRRNQAFQANHSVHNSEWSSSFVAAQSLALDPVYHFPSKIPPQDPTFEDEMDKYRASVEGRHYRPRTANAAQVEEKHSSHDWKTDANAGKKSYILTLHNDIVKEDAKSKQRARSKSAGAGFPSKSRSSGPERGIPQVLVVRPSDGNFNDDMTALTDDRHLRAVNNGGHDALTKSADSDDDNDPYHGAQPIDIQNSIGHELEMVATADPLMANPDARCVESTFIAMEDQLKQIGLHIHISDINELFAATTAPPFLCLPLAGYIACLCGSTVSFNAVVDLLTTKAANLLGFIHEVEPLVLSLRRVRKAYELKARFDNVACLLTPKFIPTTYTVDLWELGRISYRQNAATHLF
jgi:hypothetical protein